MTGWIYLIKGADTLIEMREQAYGTEVQLQDLLAKYPNLLAGDQIDSAAPRRWVLVTREAGIPFEEGGSEHLSLDHLFLDQDGVPTLVEVKRSSDTRARREVVAQMLDCAANLTAYSAAESIKAKFEARCHNIQADPEQVLRDILDPDVDEEQY